MGKSNAYNAGLACGYENRYPDEPDNSKFMEGYYIAQGNLESDRLAFEKQVEFDQEEEGEDRDILSVAIASMR